MVWICLRRREARSSGSICGPAWRRSSRGAGPRSCCNEVMPLLGLSSLYTGLGLFAESSEILDRAEREAAAGGDDDLPALVKVSRGRHEFMAADYGRAVSLYQEVRAEVLRVERPAWLKIPLYEGLGDVDSALGRHREAMADFREERRMQEGNHYVAAAIDHFIAAEAQALARDGQMPQEEADALLHQALDEEVRYGVRLWLAGGELHTRLLLAQRLGPSDEGVRQVELALAGARQDQDLGLISDSLRLLASFEVAQGKPGRAQALYGEALSVARRGMQRQRAGYALLGRAQLAWTAGENAAAIADAKAGLDELDLVRAQQPDAIVRARTASAFAAAYSAAAAGVLEAREPDAATIDVALSFIERLRSRSLLEQLSAARPAGPVTGVERELREKRAAALGRLAALQQQLLLPSPDAAGRAPLMSQLLAVEGQEEAARDGLARLSPHAGPPPTPPTLAELQAALGEDEALLVFQLLPREALDPALAGRGSSWVLVIARGVVRAIRLREVDQLSSQIDLWSELIARRDGSEQPGAARLYQQLIASALSTLPPGTRNLIVVPDGPLAKLPFDALRTAEGAAALAERYVFSLAPSAALWLRWRRATPDAPSEPVLALADPAPSRAPSAQRGGAWLSGAQLGALPFARREGEAVLRALGGGTLLLGADASERALKTVDLRRFGVLHLAAHALVDEEKPERSAVVLAPGAPEEDGLLQAREIAALELGGRTVVLASCSSSRGARLGGEGVMSLARAFFEAGAETVIGSLWPLRDDDTEALMGAFYPRLAEGRSVGEAMSLARRDQIAAGKPAAAWAGLVVLGDGALKPVRPLPRRNRAGLFLSTLVALLMVAAAVAVRRRRSRPAF